MKVKTGELSQDGKTIRIGLELDGELENGNFQISPKTTSNPVKYYENSNLMYPTYPILVPASFFYNTEREEQLKTVSKGMKTSMTILTIIAIPLSSTIGVMIIKSIQMFDYLNFINIQVPQNVKSFINVFESNILNFVPNPFGKKEFDSGDAVGRRLVEIGNKTKNCRVTDRVKNNDMSCYFLNSSGDLTLHFLIYMAIKLLMLMMISCLKEAVFYVQATRG